MKVVDAIGAQLDWMVAKCENPDISIEHFVSMHSHYAYDHGTFDYSTDWAQGGPIIEREGINTSVNYQDDAFGEVMYRVGWKASYWNDSIPGTPEFLVWAYGDTALIAAMRCIAMAKLGKEIEIPQELMRNKP